MIYSEIEALLKQVTGLEAASIGAGAVERAARARVAACALDAHSYLQRLRTSTTEMQLLIDAVVVPETWFFRDLEAFAALVRIVCDEWLLTHGQETLRLLSLPCSTGEEPYSIAMALLDANVPANRFRVDAVDVSTQSLAHAKRGVYGKNSFRGAELGFRERYFEETAQGQRLHESVRAQVCFRHGNLIASDVVPEAEIYDVIFCRNLLIYFDCATQDRAIEALRRQLTPQGLLFVGPSEAALLLSHDFASAKVPHAFAFRKTQTVPLVSAPLVSIPASVRSIRPPPARINVPVSLVAPPAVLLESGSDRELKEASDLADQGRLLEAQQSCEEHLRKHGPSVHAFHLMGLIRAAGGNLAQAQQHYRKALYLDQNHHDTLLHLGLLLEKQGDSAGAQVLRNRLRRLDRSRVN